MAALLTCALIENLAHLATGGLTPDLTILLDCPEEVGLKRAMARINASSGAREERFEQESLRFHQAVREGYLKLAAAHPERFIVVDGTLGISEAAAAIRSAVLSRIPRG